MWALHHSKASSVTGGHICVSIPQGTDEWWSTTASLTCLEIVLQIQGGKSCFRRNLTIRDSEIGAGAGCPAGCGCDFPGWDQPYPQEQSSQRDLAAGTAELRASQRSWGSGLSPDNTTLPHPSTSPQGISAACQRLLRLP